MLTQKKNSGENKMTDPTRISHWWYDFIGHKSFHNVTEDIKGELCRKKPSLVPQDGAMALINVGAR